MIICLLGVSFASAGYTYDGNNHWLSNQPEQYHVNYFDEDIYITANVRVSDMDTSRTDGKLASSAGSQIPRRIAIEAWSDPAIDFSDTYAGCWAYTKDTRLDKITVTISTNRPTSDVDGYDLDSGMRAYIIDSGETSSHSTMDYVYDIAYASAASKLPYGLDTVATKVKETTTSDTEYSKDITTGSATYIYNFGKSSYISYAYNSMGFLLQGNPNIGTRETVTAFTVDINIDTVFQEYWTGLGPCPNFKKVTSGPDFSMSFSFSMYRGSTGGGGGPYIII